MPANLNALIRYKTIHSCLYGGRRRWSIDELIDACTAVLGEACGRYRRVSERTLRDDIRIMRSDILGFNAPIKQKEGLYYYDDPKFSLGTFGFTDSPIIERVLRIIFNLRKEVKHPDLELAIIQLLPLASHEFIEEINVKDILLRQTTEIIDVKNSVSNYNHIKWRLSGHFDDALEDFNSLNQIVNQIAVKPGSPITWERIFNLIPGPSPEAPKDGI